MIAKTREISVAEYFAIDEASDIRHEYIDGEIYPMPGGSPNHGLIISCMITALMNLTKGRDCFVYPGDIRVRIDASKYVYPDVSAICGEPDFEDGNGLAFTNPALVVEVLSPSSIVYDHHDKLHMYGSVPSIQGYLILDQERIFADWYTRDGAGWHLRQYSHSADVIPLAPLDIELPLAEVYSRVSSSSDPAPEPGPAAEDKS